MMRAFPLLLLLLLTILSQCAVNGDIAPQNEAFFFPAECNTTARTCCPSYESAICGGTVRGACSSIVALGDQICDTTGDQRDYLWWFTDSFDSACVCNGNYYGVACESCAAGWMGDDCMTRAPVRVRRNFKSLSQADQEYALNAFKLAKTTPHPFQPSVSLYDFVAATHYWAMSWFPKESDLAIHPALRKWPRMAYGHQGPNAPAFHRRIVWEMEHVLQLATKNSSFSIPYWDWTSSTGNDYDETLAKFGGTGDSRLDALIDGELMNCMTSPSWADGDSAVAPPIGCMCPVTRGPFAGWKLIADWGQPRADGAVLARSFGCQTRFAPSLPTKDTGDYVVSILQYDTWYNDTGIRGTFRNLLGGAAVGELVHTWPENQGDKADMHKRVHRWVAGSMVGNHSASDPLFFMLHSYADVVFERWARNAIKGNRFHLNNSWPSESHPGHGRNECTGPFYPLQKNIAMFVSSLHMGYTFDFFQTEAAEAKSTITVVTSISIDTVNADTKVPTEKTIGSGIAAGATTILAPWLLSGPDPRMSYSASIMPTQADYPIPTDPTFLVSYECGTSSRSCCPLSLGEVCGGVTRGVCSSINETGCDVTNHARSLWWLADSFDTVCVCKGNYAGVSCSECAPGFAGTNCTEVEPVRIRRDFNTLAHRDMQYIVSAFMQAKVTPHANRPAVSVFDYFASLYQFATRHADELMRELHPTYAAEHRKSMSGLHSATSASTSPKSKKATPTIDKRRSKMRTHMPSAETSSLKYNLGGPAVVSWHRWFIMDFERHLSLVTNNKSFVLPYWAYDKSYGNNMDAALRWFGRDGSSLSVKDCRVAIATGSVDSSETEYSGCNCSIVSPGPFHQWKTVGNWATKTGGTLTRSFGCRPDGVSLPVASTVDHIVSMSEFHSFTQHSFTSALSGKPVEEEKASWPMIGKDMYDRLHSWFGGTMSGSTLASPASDPLFYLAHAYTDLISERWIRNQIDTDTLPGVAPDPSVWPLTGLRMGHNREECMGAVFPLRRNIDYLRRSSLMGYSYDVFAEQEHTMLNAALDRAAAEARADVEARAVFAASTKVTATDVATAAAQAAHADVAAAMTKASDELIAAEEETTTTTITSTSTSTTAAAAASSTLLVSAPSAATIKKSHRLHHKLHKLTPVD